MNLEGRCLVYVVRIDVSEWVSVAGEDEWYKKHGRLDGSNFTLNNIHKINSDNIEPINTRQCCTLS